MSRLDKDPSIVEWSSEEHVIPYRSPIDNRMHRYFVDFYIKKKMPDGGPTAGTIAWLLWGGSAGLAFARRVLKQEEILKSYIKEITNE
jgi:hypothetical protein